MTTRFTPWLPLLLCACAAPPSGAPSPSAAPTVEPADALAAPAFTVIALEHVDAADVATTLTEFLEEAAAGGDATAHQVLADPRSNSLLVLASPERTLQIQALVDRLDAE